MNESTKEVMLKSFLFIKDKEIKNLEDEISIKSKQIMELESCIKTLNDEQLSASQAREVKLREALEMIAGKRYCLDVLMSNSDIANEALSAQLDTTALEEYVMSRLEVVAFHHDDEGLSYENSFTGNVTLYRIKDKTE